MSGEIACHGCDLLVDVSALSDGATADCPRCGGFLTRFRTDAYERVLASALGAIICLLLANSFPFLSFAASGLESVMTLRSTPMSLWEHGMPEVALLVAAFIIYIPAAVLVLLVLLAVPLNKKVHRWWLKPVAHLLFELQNWAMVEVFIIGVIVSLVKIAAMATVVLGISFWAYAAFSILFTYAVISLDRYQCWKLIEELEAA
ncbi:MAG: paraquat-inducible protein A [Halieaceae bacterium]